MDILADILRASLRTEDFNMEKNVIIEEIGMYEDQPNWSAYDHAKEHYFADHPLGNSILGTPASITALTRDQMVAYHNRRYVAPNILAAAAGKFDWDDSGSRLYWALIDPGLAESADTSFHEYEGTGSFYTMLSCDPEQSAENLATVRDILADVQKKGITAEELQQAKSKIGSRVVRGSE